MMYTCDTGHLMTRSKSGRMYYYIRLNLVDQTAKNRKDKYKTKDIATGLLVGGKTGRIKNENLAQEQLTQAIRDYSPIGADTRFDRYVEYWMNETDKSHDLEVTTKEAYRYKTKYIIQYFKNTDLTLAEVEPSDIRDFISFLHEVKSSKDKPLSDVYIRDISKTCSQVFSFAQMNGHLFRQNPFASVKMPKVRKKSDDEPYISEDQIPVFKEAVHVVCGSNIILESAFMIGLFYGLRREEICGLRWSAIRNGNIHIEHTVARVNTLVVKDRAKTDASNRHCAILPEIDALFNQIKKEQARNKALFGNTYLDSDYIFTWQNGKPFAPDFLTKKFRKIIDRSETLDKRLHLHNLRATCVSILAHGGVSISDVAQWIGDSVDTTTKYYLRTCNKNQLQTGQAMADILF